MKRQVSKETFDKWRCLYEREQQSMTWLRCSVADEQNKLLVYIRCVARLVESTSSVLVGSRTSSVCRSRVLVLIRQVAS